MPPRYFQPLMVLGLAVCIALDAPHPSAAQKGPAEPPQDVDTVFRCEMRYVRSAVFSRDSGLLYLGGVAADPKTDTAACLSVWDTTTCTEVKRVRLGYFPPANKDKDDPFADYTKLGCVALSPDGKWVAAAAGNDIKLLNTNDWRGKALLRTESWVHALAVSPDGKRLAAGCARSVRLWDVASGKEEKTFQTWGRNQGDTPSVSFSVDGKRLAFGGRDKTGALEIRVWDLESGKEVFKQEGDTLVCFHPVKGNLLFGVKRLWDLDAKKGDAKKGLPLDPDDPDFEPDSQGTGLALNSDATVKVMFNNKAGRLWLPGDTKPRTIDWGLGYSGQPVAVSPDGKKMVLIDHGVVSLWNLTILAKSKKAK